MSSKPLVITEYGVDAYNDPCGWQENNVLPSHFPPFVWLSLGPVHSTQQLHPVTNQNTPASAAGRSRLLQPAQRRSGWLGGRPQPALQGVQPARGRVLTTGRRVAGTVGHQPGPRDYGQCTLARWARLVFGCLSLPRRLHTSSLFSLLSLTLSLSRSLPPSPGQAGLWRADS